MKSPFKSHRSTTVTLRSGDDEWTLQVYRLPANRRPMLLQELYAEFGKDTPKDDLELGTTFAFAALGLSLREQVDTVKQGKSWREYTAALSIELEAACLDEGHVNDLLSAGNDDDDTPGEDVENAAGN